MFGIISQRGFESRPVRQNTEKALQIINLQGFFAFQSGLSQARPQAHATGSRQSHCPQTAPSQPHRLINRQRSHSLGWHRIATLIHKPAHTSIPDCWGQHTGGAAHLVTRALTAPAQRLQQTDQIVMVQLMHQGQQLPKLP